MDNVTQRMPALVEEASAAAASLEEQAARLTQAWWGRFRIQGGERVVMETDVKPTFAPNRPAVAGADN